MFRKAVWVLSLSLTVMLGLLIAPTVSMAATKPANICRVSGSLAAGKTSTLGLPAGSSSISQLVSNDKSCTDDGRLNQNCSAPLAIYCNGTVYDIYYVDPKGVGTLNFSFDSQYYDGVELDEPYRICGHYGVDVYYLPSGQYMASARQSDGKLYTFIWSKCSPGGDAEFSK